MKEKRIDHTPEGYDGDTVIRVAVYDFRDDHSMYPRLSGGSRMKEAHHHVFESEQQAEFYYEDLLGEARFGFRWLTRPVWKTQKFEKQRLKMEGLAAEIMAQDHIKQMDSKAFLDSLQDRIDAEGQDREDTLASGFDVAPRQWIRNYNYREGDSKYQELMDWMEIQFPMLVAKWRSDVEQH